MRRSAGVGLFLIFMLSLGLSGCGSKGSKPTVPATPATVTLAPASISLDKGAVFQVSVTVLDKDGKAIFSQTPTFASSNTAVAVSTSGLLCAGAWDSLTAPVVCTPAAAAGTSNLTATAGGITSNVVVVSVHEHVDNITLSPASVDCDSQDVTETFTATATHFDGLNHVDITSTVGTFSWFSTQSGVATIDVAGPSNPGPPLLTASQARVKAQHPGLANIFASISGTSSVPAPFITCSPATITIDVPTPTFPDTSTSFSIATSDTKQLAADVVDTATPGVTITGLDLTWTSSQPAVASVSTAGLVTGVAPGVSVITASCTPSSCNTGVNQAVYSNPVTANIILGTATTTTVYATTTADPGTSGQTSLIPISTSTSPNTAGTAILLPAGAIINSLLINPAGTHAFLGSSKGLVVVNLTNNTVSSTVTDVLGTALAVSPSGQFVVTSDTSAGQVYVYDSTNNTLVAKLSIPGATHAAFTTDSFKAYIVAVAGGTGTLYQYSPSLPLRTITMTDVANDVAVNSSGQFAYIAGGETSKVAARATCRNDSSWTLPPPEDVVATTATPDLIASASTGDLLAVEGSTSTMDKVTPDITDPAPGTSCPPTLSDSLMTKNWNTDCCGITSFSPRQIIVTPDGTKAYVTSDQTVLLGYNITGINANTTFTAAIGGASTFTGGALIDSSKVYVGGSDSAVHVIDVASGTEGTPIPLGFVPDLVAVRPH